MPTVQKIEIKNVVRKERLDAYLSRLPEQEISRSQIKKMIDDGSVLVNERRVPPHYQVKEGDIVQMEITVQKMEGLRAEDIPLEIIYEDEDVIVINKAVGMVVHPAHGNPHHTLVNALLYHTEHLSGIGDPVRPGIVHRLDKDTSGVLVVAKNNIAHAHLAKQFRLHTIDRTYFAFVRGIVQHEEGLVEEPVGRAFLSRKKIVIKPSGGKDAATLYRVLKRFRNATWLEIRPRTGRTHQIRVHMAHLGHPILGDSLYGIPSQWISRQALHAHALAFDHPKTKKRMSFQSPLPQDLQVLLGHLESER